MDNIPAALKEENLMLKDKLERANQQIKLLAAVLQIVHEDLSMKNEQLEILYSNLRSNPVWLDCMATVHHGNDNSNENDDNTEAPQQPDHRQHEQNGAPCNTRNTSNLEKHALSQILKRDPVVNLPASSSSFVLIARARANNRSVIRSRSLSPSGHGAVRLTRTQPLDRNENSAPEHREDGNLVLSADLFQTINEDTKCYLNCMAEDTQVSLCSFLAYQELVHLSQTNKLWRDTLTDDLVWKICFRVKWPLDEFTYSSDSGDESTIQMVGNPYDPDAAFSKFQKSLRKRKQLQNIKRERKHKHKRTRINREADPELSESPNLAYASAPAKPWRRQFIDRIHIEKNWRQGRSKVMTLIGHNGSVTDLKFDEYRLVTGSDDGSIILWHLQNMKKWRPKAKQNIYNEHARKQLERDPEAETVNAKSRYKFFPTMEEKKNAELDENDDDGNDNENELQPAVVSTEEDVDGDSDSSSATLSASQHPHPHQHQDTRPHRGHGLQLNNLYHLNDDWSMNDTKLSAWRHSFLTSFGGSFRDRLPTMLSGRDRSKKKKKTIKALATDSMQLQNHHYSRDLNFKRLSFQGHGGPIWALDFDHELLVSGSYDKCIKIWNILNGNCRATLRGHEEWVSGIKLRGKHVLSCSWDACIRLWRLDDNRFSGKCVSKLQSQSGNAIYCIQWSQDKNFIVSGCRHQAVQVWDLQKEKMIKTFMGHTKQVYCLQMSNNLIVSGSADRTIKMWDPRSAACLGSFEQHMGPVMRLQFDDHKLISAGYDKQVRIFDLRTRKQLHSLSGHSKVIFALQYDHKKIITGSADRRVLVWNFE